MATLTDWINGGRLDLLIDAIKAKTDPLTFTVANQVDANALSGGGSGLDAAGVRAAVGLASANLDTQLADLPTNAELATALGTADDAVLTAIGTLQAFVDTEVAAILADTNELQTDWVNGGRLDLLIDAIKAKTDQFVFTVANQVNANALSGGGGLDAAGVRSAVGLASANLETLIAAIDDAILTQIALVKAKTDQLTFGIANQVDARVKTINATPVTGDGSATPFV
jgi:hypothetical protein